MILGIVMISADLVQVYLAAGGDGGYNKSGGELLDCRTERNSA